MTSLITVQLVAQTACGDQAWRTGCGPLVSALDALAETLCRKSGTARFYHPGELIDAPPHCPALRWILVISMGRQRLEALHELLQHILPPLAMQVPSHTMQWKIESLTS